MRYNIPREEMLYSLMIHRGSRLEDPKVLRQRGEMSNVTLGEVISGR